MPIPALTIDGVLPPFIGPEGPGGSSQDMTPYLVTAEEVVSRFGRTERRREILRGWLGYRAALRAAGFVRGFQWVDGSFVEDKDPNDIDVMTFAYRPAILTDPTQRAAWVAQHANVLSRPAVKQQYEVDAFQVDLAGNPETLVTATRYYGALFSHRRGDSLWKGMLSVRLENAAEDQTALAAIPHSPVAVGTTEAAP